MNVHFMSKSHEWETPQALFDSLSVEFDGFDLDPCATELNAKCKKFFTKEDNGLSKRWDGKVFMNPPYGRVIGQWVQKAFEHDDLTVCLLPARTDTKWFHDYILGKAEIRFIRGRLKFGNCTNSAPFPSMIVIFRRR